MPPDAEAADPWSVTVRGSFFVGRCGTCAWTGPARRARFSVAADMTAHEVLCRSAATQDVPIPAGARVTAEVGEVVASGRERLSAQGRS
ncbi:hypothetical protein [Humibacillus xanthopallidus]|uniref:Uncharacterized protein n=1 Tax=Humibacillus xanthopallidus TaxID=412689 RepID=A0A543HU52_9MICO|nr:hypothetical protein [Humibacillus xanthopallidus]TQM61789.1 hypothetical protein FBY41_1806 [Humibacillus xanthopallidus]